MTARLSRRRFAQAAALCSSGVAAPWVCAQDTGPIKLGVVNIEGGPFAVARSTQVDAVRAALTDMKLNTVGGEVEMRGTEHQLLRPW